MELETVRLQLDALHPDDAAALFRYRADPDVARYQGWRPTSLAEAEGFIRKQCELATPPTGRWFQRAIRLRGDRALIGDLGFCLSVDRQVEFGITLAPEWQGRGIAREALRALLAELFGRLDVHRVHASVDPRNNASIALLRALGMRQEAHFRESLHLHGEWVDDMVFALLVREWHDMAPKGAEQAVSR